MPGTTPYAPLWCKSYYSFLEGASSPEQYVDKAVELGLPFIALTDRDGVYGIVKGHVAARQQNIPLIIGSETTIRTSDGCMFNVLFLVRNQQGYANLCSLITQGRLRCEKARSEVSVEECCAHAQGLYAIWLPASFALLNQDKINHAIESFQQAFSNCFYLMVCRHREASEPVLENLTRTQAKYYGLHTVAALEVLYHDPRQQPVQDILSCIRNHQTLTDCGNHLKPNANHALVSMEDFSKLYADDLQSVHATVEIAEDCTFQLDEIRYIYPEEKYSDGLSASETLQNLTRRGALQRYAGEVPEAVAKQLDKELQLIQELGYSSYFLTMHRIVNWCEQQNIMCQGRGSAANSAVCFCLGITSIDPVQMELLFERFLSRERDEPPDIDLDIEHERREEVIQHVYQAYGREHAAMVATVIRYRCRSAVRDIGTALGIPNASLYRLSKQLDSYGLLKEDDFVRAGLDPSLHVHRLLINLTQQIMDFPRHLSIHPGGFLFATGPIREFVPVENATMPNRTVIQWEKDDIEAMKIFKVDLLGLGALTQLHRCFDLIEQHRGHRLNMHSLPKDDPQVYKMLHKADTTGVFQIESRAQMSMLPRLKPNEWYDLVVQIAIVRPGPISGGMVHPYLRRRAGEEEVIYPHSCLIPVLKKTLGIPIFQEQVIKLAMVAADYLPGEADQLRRDMAAWRRTDRLERHRGKLVSRMIAKGIEPEFAEQVFDQIRGFGEYGFPESHSASFALIAYVASFLKCHYPAEFACSLLNAQPMGFYAPATIIEDARRHGVRIRPVVVGVSRWDCAVEPCNESVKGFALRIGLRYVKGLPPKDGMVLESVPTRIQTIEELVRYSGISKTSVRKLAEAGALQKFSINRRSALWGAHGVSNRTEIIRASDSSVKFSELTPHELNVWDYQSTGVSSSGHILCHYREELRSRGLPDAREVNSLEDGTHVRYAGIVICRQRPASASSVVFMTLEDETGFVNTIFWPRCFEHYSSMAKTLVLLGVSGKLQVADNVVHLVVKNVWDPGNLIPWAKFKSRDFH